MITNIRSKKNIFIGVVMCIAINTMLLNAGDAPASTNPPLRSGPPVGFFLAFPSTEGLENTTANAGFSYIFNPWQMKSYGDNIDEQIVNFDTAKQWLDESYRTGLQAFPVLEASIQGSMDTPWRRDMWAKAGHNSIDSTGKEMEWVSIHSPLFHTNVFNYLNQYIDWIKTNDISNHVPAYVMGGGWVWPYGKFDYHPMAFSAFRDWLRLKYNSISNLNSNWGSEFGGWEKVKPPTPICAIGDGHIGSVTFSFSDHIDFLWESPAINVEPGCEYRATVQSYQENGIEKFGVLQFMFFDDEGKLMHIKAGNNFELKQTKGQWETTSIVMKSPVDEPRLNWALGEEAFPTAPPPTAKTLKLGLKLLGPGKIKFRNPSIKKWSTGKELLCPKGLSLKEAGKNWNFRKSSENIIVESEIESSKEGSEPIFMISVQQPPLPYKNTGVALEDWVNFSHESMANWLNTVAGHIKERDPGRDVISYIAFTFGFHNQWEGNNSVMRLDIDLANSPKVDIYGIQLALADRDFSYATSSIDVARKYGKPVYATDLIDFPDGLYSGFETIYRASLATVQHGLDGIFYFAWTAPPIPQYEYRNHLSKTDLNKLISDTKTAIETVSNYKLQTKIAMLEPLMSYSLADEGGHKGDQLDSGGLYHLILDTGFIPDIITPYEISRQGSNLLKKYDLIFVSDCPVLDNKVNQLVIDYVKNGGVIIGSGRSPMKDLAGSKLKTNLLIEKKLPDNVGIIKAASNPSIKTIGDGKVYWMNDMIGKAYWGETRRWAKHGDTVPLFVRTDYSNEAKLLRRYLRRTLSDLIDSAGIKSPARVDASDGAIHLAVYRKPEKSDELLLFLVHTEPGRSESIPIRMDSSVKSKKGIAWIDFEKKIPVTINAEGILQVPDFAHSCVIIL